LAGVRAWRDLQKRAAINGRHLDFGAQIRLRNRDWHTDLDVVPLPGKEPVRIHANGDVEIPGGGASRAGIPFARHSQSRASPGTWRNSYLHLLRTLHTAITATIRANIL